MSFFLHIYICSNILPKKTEVQVQKPTNVYIRMQNAVKKKYPQYFDSHPCLKFSQIALQDLRVS